MSWPQPWCECYDNVQVCQSVRKLWKWSSEMTRVLYLHSVTDLMWVHAKQLGICIYFKWQKKFFEVKSSVLMFSGTKMCLILFYFNIYIYNIYLFIQCWKEFFMEMYNKLQLTWAANSHGVSLTITGCRPHSPNPIRWFQAAILCS